MLLPEGLCIYDDINSDTMFYTKILSGARMIFNEIFYREHYIFLSVTN